MASFLSPTSITVNQGDYEVSSRKSIDFYLTPATGKKITSITFSAPSTFFSAAWFRKIKVGYTSYYPHTSSPRTRAISQTGPVAIIIEYFLDGPHGSLNENIILDITEEDTGGGNVVTNTLTQPININRTHYNDGFSIHSSSVETDINITLTAGGGNQSQTLFITPPPTEAPTNPAAGYFAGTILTVPPTILADLGLSSIVFGGTTYVSGDTTVAAATWQGSHYLVVTALEAGPSGSVSTNVTISDPTAAANGNPRNADFVFPFTTNRASSSVTITNLDWPISNEVSLDTIQNLNWPVSNFIPDNVSFANLPVSNMVAVAVLQNLDWNITNFIPDNVSFSDILVTNIVIDPAINLDWSITNQVGLINLDLPLSNMVWSSVSELNLPLENNVDDVIIFQISLVNKVDLLEDHPNNFVTVSGINVLNKVNQTEDVSFLPLNIFNIINKGTFAFENNSQFCGVTNI